MDDNTQLTFTGPRWAWETIWETIACDKESSAFDPELRSEIANAEAAIEGPTP